MRSDVRNKNRQMGVPQGKISVADNAMRKQFVGRQQKNQHL